MDSSIVTIAEAGVALAIVAGVLIALSDSPAYPLAMGMVVIAGLYVLLEHPKAITTLTGSIGWAQKHLKGGTS